MSHNYPESKVHYFPFKYITKKSSIIPKSPYITLQAKKVKETLKSVQKIITI